MNEVSIVIPYAFECHSFFTVVGCGLWVVVELIQYVYFSLYSKSTYDVRGEAAWRAVYVQYEYS